jgi:peptidoglycan/xylan/chitin deacetylase (PgdA/CDA1 family)
LTLGPVPVTGNPARPQRSASVRVISRISTKDPVVFVTIDDGATKDPKVLALLRAAKVPVTPFLTSNEVSSKPSYFATVQKITGQHPQDHTVSHPDLKGRPLSVQKREICVDANLLTRWYRTRPWLFRPPYGSYDATTKAAAHACGMSTIVLWDVVLDKKGIHFAATHHFRRGDILLTHWQPGLDRWLRTALARIRTAGLHVGALQDYLRQPR